RLLIGFVRMHALPTPIPRGLSRAGAHPGATGCRRSSPAPKCAPARARRPAAGPQTTISPPQQRLVAMSAHASATPVKIARALLSVSDKTGLVDLARALAARGVEL